MFMQLPRAVHDTIVIKYSSFTITTFYVSIINCFRLQMRDFDRILNGN